jgi:hypothetical protein
METIKISITRPVDHDDIDAEIDEIDLEVDRDPPNQRKESQTRRVLDILDDLERSGA